MHTRCRLEETIWKRWLLLSCCCALHRMGNAGEKKKQKANAETLLFWKIFIAVCHVRLNLQSHPSFCALVAVVGH